MTRSPKRMRKRTKLDALAHISSTVALASGTLESCVDCSSSSGSTFDDVSINLAESNHDDSCLSSSGSAVLTEPDFECVKASSEPSSPEIDSVLLHSEITSTGLIDEFPSSLHLTDIISAINEHPSVEPDADLSLDDSSVPFLPLCKDSEVSQHNATLLLRAFCSKFNLNDVATFALFDIIRSLLPHSTNLPTPHSIIASSKKLYEDLLILKHDDGNEHLRVISFGNTLVQVIERNFRSIYEYFFERQENPIQDISATRASPFDILEEKLTIDLILSSDGVTITESSSKKLLLAFVVLHCSVTSKTENVPEKHCIGSASCCFEET